MCPAREPSPPHSPAVVRAARPPRAGGLHPRLGDRLRGLDRRQRRPARDPARPRRRACAAAVGGRRVPADARLAAARRRVVRRPVRRAPGVPGGHRRLRDHIGALRRGAGRDDPDPRARPAGHRRRRAHPRRPRGDRRHLQRRGARRGGRRLDGVDGRGVRDRAALGGWLVTNASWRWVFIVNVPFAIATAALVAWVVPARERPRAAPPGRRGRRAALRGRPGSAGLRADRGARGAASATP